MDETRHGLEDGDFVTFSEVKGMEGLNGCEPRKITTKGMSSVKRRMRVGLRTPRSVYILNR
jgi:hypothetical protein